MTPAGDSQASKSGARGRTKRASRAGAANGHNDQALDRLLGVRFKDVALREIALTHRSYAFENDTQAPQSLRDLGLKGSRAKGKRI